MEAVHLKLQCFVCYLPCVRGNGGVTESPDNGFLVLELFQVIFLGSTFFFCLFKKKKKNLSRQETAFFSLSVRLTVRLFSWELLYIPECVLVDRPAAVFVSKARSRSVFYCKTVCAGLVMWVIVIGLTLPPHGCEL